MDGRGPGKGKGKLESRWDFVLDKLKENPTKQDFIDWEYNLERFLEDSAGWTGASLVLQNVRLKTEPIEQKSYFEVLDEIVDEVEEVDEDDKDPYALRHIMPTHVFTCVRVCIW